MTDLNHPNVRAGLLRETVELFKHASEDGFDPQSDQDRGWMTNTFSFLVGLIATDSDMAMIVGDFPGAQQVPDQGVPQWPQPGPSGNPEPFPQPHQQVPGPPQQVPYNPVPQPPAGMPQGQPMPPPQAMPYNAPQQVAPGQLHAGSTSDDIWANICQQLQSGNLADWYDNRASKRTQNSPDFRHRSVDALPNRAGKVYKLSGYIKDAPPWALQVLQQYPPRG